MEFRDETGRQRKQEGHMLVVNKTIVEWHADTETSQENKLKVIRQYEPHEVTYL